CSSVNVFTTANWPPARDLRPSTDPALCRLPIVISVGQLQHCHKGFLGDFHVADPLHSLLALGLLLEELSLSGDVAAVAFGENVLAHRGDRFPGDDPTSDRRLDWHLEKLTRNQVPKLLHQFFSSGIGFVNVTDNRKSVDWCSSDEDLQLYQFLGPVTFQGVVQGRVSLGA